MPFKTLDGINLGQEGDETSNTGQGGGDTEGAASAGSDDGGGGGNGASDARRRNQYNCFSCMMAMARGGLSTYVPLPPDGGGTPNPVEGAGGTPVGPQGTATVS